MIERGLVAHDPAVVVDINSVVGYDSVVMSDPVDVDSDNNATVVADDPIDVGDSVDNLHYGTVMEDSAPDNMIDNETDYDFGGMIRHPPNHLIVEHSLIQCECVAVNM